MNRQKLAKGKGWVPPLVASSIARGKITQPTNKDTAILPIGSRLLDPT